MKNTGTTPCHILRMNATPFVSAQETTDTVSTTGKASRFGTALRSTLILALLGVTVGAFAQDTKPAEKPKEESKPVQVAAKPKQDPPQDEGKKAAPENAEPAAPAPGEVTVTGLVDFYFGYNARAPRSATGGAFSGVTTPSGEFIRQDNFGLFFNVRDRQPQFSLGEVNITRTPGKGFPLGATLTLTFGEAARLFHATEPGGTSSWQTLHNAFLSYSFPFGKRTATVDFGKWASPFGAEVLESYLNDNYSRAFNFWYGVPFYHAGGRVTVPISSKLSAQLAVTNGWNNVADDNDAKTFYAQFTYKPSAAFTSTLGYIGGLEGTGAYGTIAPTDNGGRVTTHLLDWVNVYQATPKLKLTGWASYGSAEGQITGFNGGGAIPGRITGNWLGVVGSGKYQLTSNFAVAARLEQFEDFARTGGIGPRFQLPGYLKMQEVTLTAEYTSLRGRSITRLEYRHDRSNQAVFGSGAGGTVQDQDTLYLSQVFKF